MFNNERTRRPAGGVPAAVPAVHAAREDLRLRRSRAWRRRRRGDLRTSRSTRCSTCFPEFPRERVVLSPNGYNQDVFLPMPDVYRPGRRCWPASSPSHPRAATAHPSRSRRRTGSTQSWSFCGKFADWKRLDALLRAAAIYEQQQRRDPHAGDRFRTARGTGRTGRPEPPNSGCAAPTSSVPGHRTSLRRCSAAPTSAASRPTVNLSAWCSSSAWPAVPRLSAPTQVAHVTSSPPKSAHWSLRPTTQPRSLRRWPKRSTRLSPPTGSAPVGLSPPTLHGTVSA